MTVEEIERILQTVTEKQAQLAEAQIANQSRLAELDEIVKQIAVAHKSIIDLISLHEKRLDGHDLATQATNDKLNALINAQVGLEDRQAKLDEIVKQVVESHESIIDLIRLHEKRLDGHDVTARATDDKLNALIDIQIGLGNRQAKLDEIVNRLDGRQATLDEIVNRLDGRQAISDELIRRVTESHGAIIDLISLHEKRLDDNEGALRRANGKLDALTKTERKSAKVAKKKAAKKKPRS